MGTRTPYIELLLNKNLVLESTLLDKMARDEVYKQFIRRLTAEDRSQLCCAHCKLPVYFVDQSVLSDERVISAHIKHFSAADDPHRQELLNTCPNYQGNGFKGRFSEFYKGEGKWHFETKHFVGGVLNLDPFVTPGSVKIEAFVFSELENSNSRRKPDISFTDLKGNKWAIELTNNWMNPEIITARQKFFIEQKYNLIWLFSPFTAEQESTTFRFVLFGMSEKAKGGQFNTFAFDETDKEDCRSKQLLSIHALVPHFYYDSTSQTIAYRIANLQLTLPELVTAPGVHLPYFTDTSISRTNAEKEQHRHYEALQLQRINDEKEALQVKSDQLNKLNCLSESLFVQFSNSKSSMSTESLKFLMNRKIQVIEQYSQVLLGQQNSNVEKLICNVDRLNDQIHHLTQSKNSKSRDERRQQKINRDNTSASIKTLEHNVEQLLSQIRSVTSEHQIQSISNVSSRIRSLLREALLYNKHGLVDGIQSSLHQYDHRHLHKLSFSILKSEFDYDIEYKPLIEEMIEYIESPLVYYDYDNQIPELLSNEAKECLESFGEYLMYETERLSQDCQTSLPLRKYLMKIVGANEFLLNKYPGAITDDAAYLYKVYNLKLLLDISM
jgi:hypothetical protein